MSITDELRQYADTVDEMYGKFSISAMMRDIANRIDAEHERETREQYTKGHNDGFDAGYASADDWDADHAEELAEHGWVKLPVDADGVPIHVGDEVGFASGEPDEHFTVDAFWLDLDGWHVSGEFDAMPSELRHWEAPSIDALLMQFVVDAADTASVTEMGALVDDYADRIREAVEHE